MPRQAFEWLARVTVIFIFLIISACAGWVNSASQGNPNAPAAMTPALDSVGDPARRVRLLTANPNGAFSALPQVGPIRFWLHTPDPSALKLTSFGEVLEQVPGNAAAQRIALQQQNKGYFAATSRPRGNASGVTDWEVLFTPRRSDLAYSQLTIEVQDSSLNAKFTGTDKLSQPLPITFVERSPRPSDEFFDGTGDQIAERNSKDPRSIITRDFVVAGWLIETRGNNLGDDPGKLLVEDYHYNIVVDPDFLSLMYGPTGLHSHSGTLPGNPYQPNGLYSLDDRSAGGTGLGITINSLSLPQQLGAPDQPYLHGELNAWHVNNHSNVVRSLHLKPVGWQGRGPAPAGWVQEGWDGETDGWWPWPPSNPERAGSDLKVGDYIMMKGTLWQDQSHDDQSSPSSCWDAEPTVGHGGWVEMHPPDFVARVAAPKVRKSVRMIAACAPIGGSGPVTVSHVLTPDDVQRPGSILRYQELVDGRFTDMASVQTHTVDLTGDILTVTVTVMSHPSASGLRPGRFKASYVLWWEAP